MLKPQSLRDFIVASVPELRREPGRLQMHIESGNVVARLGDDLGFEYGYKLTLTALNYTSHPSTLFVPLMIWLRVNQLDLLQNFDRAEDGVKFEVDIIDRDTYDIAIELPLTEATNITRPGDQERYQMTPAPEPVLEGIEGIENYALLPDDIVLLLNSYGELIQSRAGQNLTPPA